MDAQLGTGNVMDIQAMLKSMEKEWGKVKDEEIEAIKEEVEEVENEMEEVSEGEIEEKQMEEEMEENLVKEEAQVEKEEEEMEEEMEENLVDFVPKAKPGLDNIVLSSYTVKKASSRSEALMAFHERKRLESK